MTTHTGVKAFKCKKCGEGYQQKSRHQCVPSDDHMNAEQSKETKDVFVGVKQEEITENGDINEEEADEDTNGLPEIKVEPMDDPLQV